LAREPLSHPCVTRCFGTQVSLQDRASYRALGLNSTLSSIRFRPPCRQAGDLLALREQAVAPLAQVAEISTFRSARPTPSQ
jgi:hypothetical protein